MSIDCSLHYNPIPDEELLPKLNFALIWKKMLPFWHELRILLPSWIILGGVAVLCSTQYILYPIRMPPVPCLGKKIGEGRGWI